LKKNKNNIFSDDEKQSFYRVIFSRRDVRKNFIAKSIDDEVLYRILLAAHHAPSVGYSQPWNFILIRNNITRKLIKESFLKERLKAIELIPSEKGKRKKYMNLTLEGILESDLNICITYDHNRFGPFVIGRMTIKQAGIYSVCCAVQNLWLAARVENIGVGWVSIVDTKDLGKILKLPSYIKPIAYLCLGYVREFEDKPDLESNNWLDRMPLNEVVGFERWNNKSKEIGSWTSLGKILANQV
jgi:5,6-dimethylbenzimidazole synthase